MKLTFTAEALERIGKVYAETIQQQIKDGIDANGIPFPPGITLYQTGELYDSLQGRENGEEAFVVSELLYADIQNNRFSFAGIAPQNQAELEAKLQAIIEEGVELLED
jgi:hypothetical protein